MKQKPVWNDLNPKAITTDEMFGFIHPATREWKDGEYTKYNTTVELMFDDTKILGNKAEILSTFLEAIFTIVIISSLNRGTKTVCRLAGVISPAPCKMPSKPPQFYISYYLQ